MARPRRLSARIAAEGVRIAGTGEVVMPSQSPQKALFSQKRAPGVLPDANTDADGYTAVLEAMSEKRFQATVVAGLRQRGCLVWTFPEMRLTRAGWPDLTFLHPSRPGWLFVWELKAAKTVVTPEQERVIALLAQAPGIDARIVRPSDWAKLSREV